MRTRTLPDQEAGELSVQPQESGPDEPLGQEALLASVNEKGFALYEWISPEELRMTLERDYIKIVRWASIPLAIIAMIAGLVGTAFGPIGTIFSVLLVLGIFYGILGIILSVQFLYRSYLYTRGANVVITDGHYVSGGRIIDRRDTEGVRETFGKFEAIFDEPFLGVSRIKEKKAKAKTELFDNLKDIAWGGGKIAQYFGGSRDSTWIGLIAVMLIVGFLYAAVMGIVYFIGIFFILLFGRVFSWLAHQYLLSAHNTEHQIQSLFGAIDGNAKALEKEKHTAIRLFDSATQNDWKENLTGKIRASTELLAKLAGSATEHSRELRSVLESSQYRNIFNFKKYDGWIHTQILEPIESILLLLQKNYARVSETITALNAQINTTTDDHLRQPLIIQKERLVIQLESFERIIKMLEGYRDGLGGGV